MPPPSRPPWALGAAAACGSQPSRLIVLHAYRVPRRVGSRKAGHPATPGHPRPGPGTPLRMLNARVVGAGRGHDAQGPQGSAGAHGQVQRGAKLFPRGESSPFTAVSPARQRGRSLASGPIKGKARRGRPNGDERAGETARVTMAGDGGAGRGGLRGAGRLARDGRISNWSSRGPASDSHRKQNPTRNTTPPGNKVQSSLNPT